jgi:rhomboid protease GluP
MHGGPVHLLSNGLALFVLGSAVEALLGSTGMLSIFVVSALGGSLLSFTYSPQTSIGASGGILGLLGCLVVIGFRFRHILPPRFGRQMCYAVLLIAFTGLSAPHVIDNFAHAGGFLTGAILGWILIQSRRNLPIAPPEPVVWAGRASLLLTLVALVVLIQRLWPA